ncbi:cytochrome c biogenesis protein CcsA [Flavobacteriaceae bacterium]|uniref:cytochrome c biogenesis protein CcsA n=1 Tax=Candidatus Arcticimaribacter forsetii TaxID=2820661 RepID=UPI00207795CC|nr:cytochrome c biogenesis protein CcsA [Candidatus Arcticimaribacter forsetii]MDB2345889.1 cytochrome c biogenesis protein CcsA [Flavobacteriaceae bacterium]MDB4608906.1 cytochrome c biogenesis protein CcsA [Flavobacteriaceae bacterium]MDB4643126.1 cytochrome c biogenesis protein CcsA [Flavobacteriaceae bacterium]MDB4751432.1 cytochrome c biogenesis protein CcsA [Flavobacteriaceae bacterium]
MKERLLTYLASNRLMSVLFIAFPTAMGVGTFLESWYSTDAAKIWVYNAWWFELMMILFVFSFIGNMFKYKLFRKEKWAVLCIHLSFILILLGAFITRYIGYEGVMPIREGESTNVFLSEKTYLEVLVDGEFEGRDLRKPLTKQLLLSEHVDHDFVISDDFKGQDFSIHFIDYLENATEGLVLDPDGDRYLKIVEASDGNRHDHYLKEGEVVNIHNLLFTLNNPIDGATNIQVIDGEYFIESPFEGSFMRMADQFQGSLQKDSLQTLQLRSLYSLPNFQFVIPEPVLRGKFDIVQADQDQAAQQDALRLEIISKGESELITVLGGKGVSNDPKKITVGDLEFYVKYGSISYELPFNIRLNDFVAERYPGTEKSYSSFKSKIVVEDTEPYDYEIYMNHVLDEQGYRFFQSSFSPDEKGTVLSVNHDFWGTWVTYIGYFLLYLSMIGIFFIGKTRFKDLAKTLDKIKLQKSKLTVLFILFSTIAWSQDHTRTQIDFDSLVVADAFSKEHAIKFGSLVIQDMGGRMKPANTFSSELLRKVSKSDTYNGLDSNQVLLSILNGPAVWYNIPIIYLKRGNDSIRSITGVGPKAKYAPLISFFDETGEYKLSSQLESAYRAAVPNQFQKDFIEVDKRVNLLYSALEGKVLRIFPIPEDDNNKWVSFPELEEANFKGTDSLYVNNVLPLYFQSLRAGKANNDYTQATELLESVAGFQKRYGAKVMPSEDKIAAEIAYNKYDIFKKLFSWYLYVGTFFFFVLMIQIFKDSSLIKSSIVFFKGAIGFLFLLHTAGLIARWYISGHAPWSDAYESMIYVAWATMFFGLAFGRKSNLTMAATTFVTSMILMIAHWNWMDPAIANLQPVLDSYWLMIHVAVIVGSYGPFALSMIIGIVALLLILLTTKKNKERMNLNIKELTVINELSLTVGLIMLTIGNFLGGMWANESWGRYWGWDPKETWALISIMIYSFVIHMRLIPALKSRWMFNFSSVLAFASIMMTYFGVNFYLSGLHSYASGDKIITPNFVYYALLFVAVLGGASYWRFRKMYRK